jgi:Fur family transcriptional regulator, ferric uptake regulator
MPHQHDHLARLPDLTEALRKKERKITGPRRFVLEVLRQQRRPLTNKEIYARVAKGSCDLATIYRSLHLLESLGLVKRFDFGDRVARYELVLSGQDGHHHHLVCRCCADVVEIDECFARQWEEQIARRSGFRAITHNLEFFGICPQCASHFDSSKPRRCARKHETNDHH